MMTIENVLELVKEFYTEKEKVQKVPHYYKRKGVMIERSYPDYVYSERYYELLHVLSSEEAKIFKCSNCGEYFTYFELEHWICKKDNYICSCCYEDAMGDDL